MRDALAVAYPARWSWPAKLLLPMVHPMTLVRAIHLGLMFPLGIASFVFLVVTLAVGGSLIWTLIGPIVLLVGLYISRWFGDLEAWRVRHVASIELRRPPTGIERGQSFRQQVKTRLIDPSTWTGLVYLFLQFPIGIVAFIILVAGGAVAAAFIAAPLGLASIDDGSTQDSINVMVDLGFWSANLDRPEEIAALLVPIGILVYFVLVHFINIATAVHASWARLMLGSRAEPIALGPAETPPPAGSPPPGTSADVPEAPAPIEGSEALEPDPVAPALEESAEQPSMPDETAEPDAEPPGVEPPTPAVVPTAPGREGVPASPAIDEPGSSDAPGLLEPAAIAEEPPPPAKLAAVASGRAAALELPLTRTVVVEPEAVEAPANLLVPELDAPLLVATGEPLDALTVREREVLTLIARGYSNAAIAETFVISEGTVKTHVKRVLAKLGLRDRTQAAIYAYETNFVAARSAVPEPALEPIVLTRVR